MNSTHSNTNSLCLADFITRVNNKNDLLCNVLLLLACLWMNIEGFPPKFKASSLVSYVTTCKLLSRKLSIQGVASLLLYNRVLENNFPRLFYD
jgi:hypothetical protein